MNATKPRIGLFRVAGYSAAVAALCAARPANAQSIEPSEAEPTVSDGIALGEWLLRPSLQLRSRAEGRRYPFDTGGAPVELPGEQLRSSVGGSPRVQDQWLLLERGRIGLSAERGVIRAAIELQDARVWGEASPLGPDARDQVPNTGARLAFAEAHTLGVHPSFVRVGRQEVQWGEGRLLGVSDWSPTGRSLDAARGVLVLGQVDIEGFASILSPAGALPPEVRRGGTGGPEGPGAQLHGLRFAWHVAPLLMIEVNGLARFVRGPTYGYLGPSDLYVAGARLSGRYLGLSYSAEGACELGRLSTPGDVVPLRAYAGAARVDVATGWFWKLKVGVQGAYASGQQSDASTVTRFDPILPDVHTVHGPMGLYAWSNIIEGAAFVRASPLRESTVTVGYRHVALAQPADEWQASNLLRIGKAVENTARTLGNEIDLGLAYSPWAPLELAGGYGAFFTGEAARSILEQAGRGRPTVQHFGYLQATVTVP